MKNDEFEGKIDGQGKLELYRSFWDRLKEVASAPEVSRRLVEAVGKKKRLDWYDIREYELGVEREDEFITDFPRDGDMVLVLECENQALKQTFIKFNSPNSDAFDLAKYRKLRHNFSNLYLTNVASSGHTLHVLFGRGDWEIERHHPEEEILTMNADTVDSIHASASREANKLLALGADAMFPDGAVRNIQSELDANKSASPAVGDMFIATDTGKVYICFTAGAWTDITRADAIDLSPDVSDKYLSDLLDGGYDVPIKPSDIITKGPWVDVRAFGAVGDGVTDDTAAIQAAEDSITGSVGGTLFFPPGTYKITSTLRFGTGAWGSPIVVQGSGPGASRIKGNLTSALIQSPNPSLANHRLTIRDILVDNTSKDNAGGIGIDLTYNHLARIDNVEIWNVETGIKLAGAGAYYNEISHCAFNVVVTGIYLGGTRANENKIFGGRMNFFTTGINVDAAFNTDIIGMAFEGGAGATGVRLNDNGGKIIGCLLDGNSVNGIEITASANYSVLLGNSYSGNGTNVSDSGSNTIQIGQAGTKMLGAAISSAQWGYLGALTAHPMGADGTAGRIPRGVYILIDNGTDPSTLKCTVVSEWNGDAIAVTDNIAKGAVTGNFSLSADGSLLKIEAIGLTGNCVYALGFISENKCGSDVTGSLWADSNDIAMRVKNATTGANLDMTTLADTGRITFHLMYITTS